jgi:tetratricopeptide (TPR) repeat protein
MTGLRMPRWLCTSVLLVCVSVFGQQAPAPESQLPDATQQQPQAQPPAPPPQQPPPPDDSQQQEKKPESKIKRTLKRGSPNCIHVGGLEKCKSDSDNDEQADDSDQPPVPRQPKVPSSQPLPRSADPDESSSKDTQFSKDTRFPEDVSSAAASDVQELHPYNPHKADKNVEVGDFYFNRSNYRAAESRYAEALEYMPNHAEATYKLAESQEKLKKLAQARANYEKYLKILPRGPQAELAKKALARLDTQAKQTTSPPAQKRP